MLLHVLFRTSSGVPSMCTSTGGEQVLGEQEASVMDSTKTRTAQPTDPATFAQEVNVALRRVCQGVVKTHVIPRASTPSHSGGADNFEKPALRTLAAVRE